MEWLMELLGKGGGSVMDGYVSPKDAALAEARRTGDKRTIDLIEKGLIDPNVPELPSTTSRAIANLQSADRTRGLGINPSVIDQVEAGIAPPEMELPSKAELIMPKGDGDPWGSKEDWGALGSDLWDFSGFGELPRGVNGNEAFRLPDGTMYDPAFPTGVLPDELKPAGPDMSGLEGQPFVGDFDAPRADSGAGLTTDEDPPSDYKRPPAGRQGDGTGTAGSPATTGAGVEKAPVDTTPVKENPMNAVQRYAQDKLGWDEDKRSDMSRALITGGLATMAGTSPYAMENIGKGGLQGVDAYYDAKDQRRDESLEDDAIAMQKELHAIRLAEGKRAAEKHIQDMAEAKRKLDAGEGFDPKSPEGKLYADATQLSRIQGGDPSPEEIMEYWLQHGFRKDPRTDTEGF